MVKRTIIISFLAVFLTSCCDYYGLVNGGLRSSWKYKKYLKKRVNPQKLGIETNAIYKYLGYSYIEESDTIIYNKKYDTIKLYFRFYDNGTYYRYSKNSNETLNSSSFNPKNGNIGFVINKNDNFYFMDYSIVDCGRFLKKKFEIKGDTMIFIQGKNSFRNSNYYIKQNVPMDWLNFKPDF